MKRRTFGRIVAVIGLDFSVFDLSYADIIIV